MSLEPRLDLAKVAPGIYHAMRGFEQYLDGSGLDPVLGHLLKLRVSQINGCAFCIDMHWKDLRAAGEGEESSRPATSSRAPSSAWRRPWARAPWPSSSPTSS